VKNSSRKPLSAEETYQRILRSLQKTSGMRILIIGATGMLGKPVTEQLIESGFDVTVLVRDTDKAQALFPFAKILRGDVFDRTTLVRHLIRSIQSI
jgi:nucleoside-diphosphate-sugar epimerase